MSLMRLALSHLALAASLAWPVGALAQGTPPQPVVPSTPLQQAQELLHKGDLDRAAKQIDAYLAGHPADASARFTKGLILNAQNKNDEAIRVYTELTYDFPELPEPYNNLGVLYAARGEYEKAREALTRAIQARPTFATAYENLGDIYAQLASQSYAKALQLDAANQSAQKKLTLVKQLISTAPAKQPALSGAPARSAASR